MRFTIEKKTLAVIIIFTFLIIGIIGAIIWPTVRRIYSLNQDTYNLRLYLEKKYQRSINLRSTVKKLENIKTASRLYPNHIFHAGQELNLIMALENNANKHAVTQKINNSNFDEATRQRQIILSLTVSGSYRHVLEYLTDIERMPYFLIIRQLQLSVAANPSTRQENVVINFDISLYVAN